MLFFMRTPVSMSDGCFLGWLDVLCENHFSTVLLLLKAIWLVYLASAG